MGGSHTSRPDIRPAAVMGRTVLRVGQQWCSRVAHRSFKVGGGGAFLLADGMG